MSKTLQGQILWNARNLIANPKHWVQNDLAKTANNESCQPWDPKAVKFCAFGALLKTAYDATGDQDIAWHFAHVATASVLASDTSDDAYLYEGLFEINDRQGRLAVLALFDRALAAEAAHLAAVQ